MKRQDNHPLLRAGAYLLAALMLLGSIPITGGISHARAAETTPYYAEDFEDVELTNGAGKLPTDWEGDGLEKHIVCADPKDANNKVMQMNSTEAASKMYVQIKPDALADPAVTQAVLEYRIYTEGESTVYPLTLLNNRTDANTRVLDLALKFNGDLFLNGKSSNVYKTLSTGTWHTIKLVADQVKKICYLWIDGEYITSKVTYKGDILGLHIDTTKNNTAFSDMKSQASRQRIITTAISRIG